MRAQGEPEHAVIGEHMFAKRHRRQGRNLFLRLLLDELRAEQRQRLVIREAPHRPETLAPVFTEGPSFTVTLDDNGEATAILWGGPSCAAGTSIISAHLDVPPFATVHTTFTVRPPADTKPGVRARPRRQVEDSITSSAATIVYAEFPAVDSEQAITIRSNELNSRCAGNLLWIGPDETLLGTGPRVTTTLDNNGNAFVVALAGPSCAAGRSSIEASLNIAPFTSYLTSFNILSPRVTNP